MEYASSLMAWVDGIDPSIILSDSRIFLIALALLFGIGIWWQVLVHSMESERRARYGREARRAAVSKAPQVMSEADVAQRLAPTVELEGLQKRVMPFFERILKIARFDRNEVATRLYRAGRRDRTAMTSYIMKRGFFMVAAPLVAWLMAPSLDIKGVALVPFLILWSFGGGILVDSGIDREMKARLARVRTQFPFFLDVLVIYLDAGAAFDTALSKAEASMRSSFPDVSRDIRDLRATLDQSIDRSRALADFARAAGVEDIKTFVSILMQSERVGNPVVPSLRTLSRESKKNAVFEVEMRAQKLPTLMQLPMFLFILPAIFISVIAPAILKVQAAFSAM